MMGFFWAAPTLARLNLPTMTNHIDFGCKIPLNRMLIFHLDSLYALTVYLCESPLGERIGSINVFSFLLGLVWNKMLAGLVIMAFWKQITNFFLFAITTQYLPLFFFFVKYNIHNILKILFFGVIDYLSYKLLNTQSIRVDIIHVPSRPISSRSISSHSILGPKFSSHMKIYFPYERSFWFPIRNRMRQDGKGMKIPKFYSGQIIYNE